jgi:hypothetical protein
MSYSSTLKLLAVQSLWAHHGYTKRGPINTPNADASIILTGLGFFSKTHDPHLTALFSEFSFRRDFSSLLMVYSAKLSMG